MFGYFRQKRNVTMSMNQVWKREEEQKCQLQCFHYAMLAPSLCIYLPTADGWRKVCFWFVVDVNVSSSSFLVMCSKVVFLFLPWPTQLSFKNSSAIRLSCSRKRNLVVPSPLPVVFFKDFFFVVFFLVSPKSDARSSVVVIETE